MAGEYDRDRERKYREKGGSSVGEESSYSLVLVPSKSLNRSSSSCISFYQNLSLGLMSSITYDTLASGGDVGLL